jgi:tRNA G26 N,N-dimethylase Trm1
MSGTNISKIEILEKIESLYQKAEKQTDLKRDTRMGKVIHFIKVANRVRFTEIKKETLISELKKTMRKTEKTVHKQKTHGIALYRINYQVNGLVEQGMYEACKEILESMGLYYEVEREE